MPAKRCKSKIPFKLFSADNYSKFASRFPFLRKRQIKAKLLQAWKSQFVSEKTKPHKRNIPKNRHRDQTLLNEGMAEF